MTNTPDSTEPLVSLDSDFKQPSREQWIELAVAGLGGKQGETDELLKLRRTTLEGIPLEVLYDTAEFSIDIAPNPDSTSWDNRLRVHTNQGTGAARTSILQGLQGGITSIELHTQTAQDIATCLEGTQLDLAGISLRSGSQYAACTDALVHHATGQGIDTSKLHCALNADPIGNALAAPASSHTTAQAINADVATMAEFAKDTAHTLPAANSILVDTAIHHNAGASTVEEIHAAVATATLYLEALQSAGMSINDACDQITFQVAMDADILLGVAKLRALRALWQRVTTAMTSGDAAIKPATIVAETSQRFISLFQPWNNHLRNLAASTAAALASADALLVHPHDMLVHSTNDADKHVGDRMARNIAIILERECGLLNVHDPMAGSYAIENLTQQLMQHTWESLASTDTSEGWLDELVSGRWQTRLTHTHRQRVTLMEQEQRIAVGVNRFAQTDELTHASVHNTNTPNPSMLSTVRDAIIFEQGSATEQPA